MISSSPFLNGPFESICSYRLKDKNVTLEPWTRGSRVPEARRVLELLLSIEILLNMTSSDEFMGTILLQY